MFIWKLAELHRAQKLCIGKNVEFFGHPHEHQKGTKKIDFLSAKSTKFPPLFFTV
jgi:hypothetical protein